MYCRMHIPSLNATTRCFVHCLPADLAYQNVHSAAQNNKSPSGEMPLHAPCKSVDGLYARTKLDTYKVQGGMLTALDDGVGAVTAALDTAALPYVIVMSADNGE